MTRVASHVVLAVALLSGVPGALAQPASPAPLRNLVDDQVVRSIVYCRGEYALVMASGTQHRYPELNLRFKTDTSATGPLPGKPVIVGTGMQGDRAAVVFAGIRELSETAKEQCN